MEKFFEAGDRLKNLQLQLKKKPHYTEKTKKEKVKAIKLILSELKEVISKTEKDATPYVERYKHLKSIAKECIKLLKEEPLEDTIIEGNQEEEEGKEDKKSELEEVEIEEEVEEEKEEEDDDEEGVEEEEEEEEEEEDDEDEETDIDSDPDSEKEPEEMPPKLDLNIALKVVKTFDGSAVNLQSYIESIQLLTDYSEGVTPAELIKFLRVTLTGTARGAFDGVTTIDAAIEALKLRFGVKLTPKAVESEMLSKRQSNKTITDFGDEIAKLASKLAAAHVSQGTFASESAASNLVETVAVRAFTDGLKDQTTQFLLRARNPSTLNKAISDALECGPGLSKTNEMTLWFSNSNRGYHRGNSRGRGSQRGPRNSRGNYRGRGNYNGYNNNGYNNNGYNNSNQHNNNNYNNNNYRGNRRGRGNSHTAHVVEEQQPRQQQQQTQQNQHQQQNNRQEDANLIDLFR